MQEEDVIVDVVESLAHADGMEPEELDYCLHDYIDPDSITKLLSTSRGSWKLTFRVADHVVTITHERRIRIDGVRYASGERVDP